MLRLTVEEREYYDENTEMFVNIPSQTIELEHSLFAISKWEMRWGKAFLGRQQKTNEEMYDYIRCMTVTPDVDPMVYSSLTASDVKTITDYIEAKMSATYLSARSSEQPSGDTVTSELIYYWMVALQIPFECQYWHLNRLLMLIQICNIKNNPSKNKMNVKDLMKRNTALNAQRQAMYHSRG